MQKNPFEGFTDEQLAAEVKRREAERKKPPPLLPTSDFKSLTQYVVEAMAQVAATGQEPKDFEHFVYEGVMEALYGKSVWAWLRDRT